ncbi:MAG: peptidoglycan editing factor PgeF [Arcobacteraceae bacterium]|jgi:YfiH family protein|nr:peptidoglycan editing factor PgeF [Arcobacteraceae bacterium]
MILSDSAVLAFYTTTDDGNMAYYTTQDENSVNINRSKLSNKYGFNLSALRYMNQVHGNHIEIVDFDSPNLILECDGIITKEKNLPLMVQIADCIGVVLYDSVKKVIGVAHAGRNGTFLDISSKMITKMNESFGTDSSDVQAYLSPSIQKCCYEVDVKMAEFVSHNFGKDFVSGRFIDLQGINKMQLIKSGLQDENIHVSDTCTKCSKEPYFSYRNDSKCGRFSCVIMLKDYK